MSLSCFTCSYGANCRGLAAGTSDPGYLCGMAVTDTSALRTMWRSAAHDPANQDGSRGLCAEMLPPALRSRASALLRCSPETPPTPCRCCFCCSVAKSCLTLCDPMDCHAPGFPVPHYLLEFAQTYIHGVGDAFQPSHALLLPSPALSLSQHQGLFQ